MVLPTHVADDRHRTKSAQGQEALISLAWSCDNMWALWLTTIFTGG